MAWIESHSTLIEHRKIREVSKLLNIKPVLLMGHLHCLWHKVIELREDGDISQWTEEDIAYYSKWEEDPKKFYEILKNRFIDEKNGFKLIHDWLDYAWKYLYSKYHTNNPKLLRIIKKKHNYKGENKGQPKGQPKVSLPNQPNQPNLTVPNLTLNTISQIEDLLRQFSPTIQEKIKIYIERIILKNKSKTITDGRKLTLINELFNSKERCADDGLFGYAIDMAIQYDACNIGYINSIIRNKKGVGKLR